MLPQNAKNENSFSQINVSFIDAIKELKISKLLHQCNIRKSSRKLSGECSGEKRTAFEIFQFLLLLVFQGYKLFRFLGSKKQDIACSKSTIIGSSMIPILTGTASLLFLRRKLLLILTPLRSRPDSKHLSWMTLL